jgi:hypothetical protein
MRDRRVDGSDDDRFGESRLARPAVCPWGGVSCSRSRRPGCRPGLPRCEPPRRAWRVTNDTCGHSQRAEIRRTSRTLSGSGDRKRHRAGRIWLWRFKQNTFESSDRCRYRPRGLLFFILLEMNASGDARFLCDTGRKTRAGWGCKMELSEGQFCAFIHANSFRHGLETRETDQALVRFASPTRAILQRRSKRE